MDRPVPDQIIVHRPPYQHRHRYKCRPLECLVRMRPARRWAQEDSRKGDRKVYLRDLMISVVL